MRKSTKANGREEEGALVINLLSGGLRQVSASPLALFTQRGLSETEKPAGRLTLKQHSLSETVNMSLINMYSAMSLVSCCECM